LVFYTIGWRSFNKITGQEFKISRFLPSRKKVILIIVFPIFISFIISIVSYFINTREDSLKKEQLEQEYNQAILVVDSLKEQVRSCLGPVLEKTYQEELRNCNLLKDKIKDDYGFCLRTDYRESKSACILENDYESVDCSKETVETKSRPKIVIPTSCRNSFDELLKVDNTIKEYSILNKN